MIKLLLSSLAACLAASSFCPLGTKWDSILDGEANVVFGEVGEGA